MATFQCLYNKSKKKLEIKFIFCMQKINIKHQSFLQVDFNTLGFKIFCKLILSLLIGMIKHFQSTQSNTLAKALQYLKKEVSHKAF